MATPSPRSEARGEGRQYLRKLRYPILKGSDDDAMKQAEKIVQQRYKDQKKKFSLGDNDCQTYVVDTFVEYQKITNELT